METLDSKTENGYSFVGRFTNFRHK